MPGCDTTFDDNQSSPLDKGGLQGVPTGTSPTSP